MLLVSSAAQVPEPASSATKPIFITNGTLHVGNGKVIEKASLVIENSIITQVGPVGSIRVDVVRYELIDASGKHIYPGLILPTARLGLEDISSLRPTLDHSELGDFNPNVRALTSYNTDSEVIATLRRNGILLAQITPQSGILSGTSSIVLLDGWNWEDVAYKIDDGLHLHWPEQVKVDATKRKKEKQVYAKKVASIKKFFQDARAYVDAKEPLLLNLKLSAMRSVFSREKKIYVYAHKAVQIIEAIEFLESMNLAAQTVLVGAHEALYVADFLKARNIPVLLETHRLPSRDDEDIHLPFKLPYELHKRGILVGIGYSVSLDPISDLQNLSFSAAAAVTYGLSKEEALQMLTANTAKILGIESQAGTIEVGKDAHLIISKGDILNIRSNQITHAFIRGKSCSLGRQAGDATRSLYEEIQSRKKAISCTKVP